jgi:general secretion pathway protein J
MNGQRGFTLVEMLVAISVAALLVSLVYGAVRVGQRSARAMEVRTEDTEAMRIGWQFLHDAVSRARPVSDPRETENQTGFYGSADKLEFVADMPAYVGLGGLIRIRLASTATHEADQLLLTRERFDKSLPEATIDGIEEAVLVEDLDKLQIAYFGQVERTASPAWHSRWSSPDTLPNLVSISVVPAEGRAWPILIARPLTGTTPLDDGELPDDAESFNDPEEVPD